MNPATIIARTLRYLAATIAIAAMAATMPASAGRLAAPASALAYGEAHLARSAQFAAKAAGGVVDVVEFYNAGLQHYFISADPAEIAVLDSGAFGGAWKRTGATFPAWDISGAPAGTVPVCRFFGTDRYRADGSRIGPNSHFYTADPNECAFVKIAFTSVAADGIAYPAWTFESNAFAVRLPVAGACPADTTPLYRTYNNGANGDPNHRYSTSAATLQGMAGWTFEGLVMCLPQQASGPPGSLPPQNGSCSGSDCPAGTLLGGETGLVNVVIQIGNTTAGPIELVIPAGQTFVATPPTFQDGLALDTLRATIAPGTTRTFIVPLFCMQQSRSPSSSFATYAPGPVTTNAALLDLISLTRGRLDTGSDPLGLKALASQFGVWEITDGRGSLTAQQRTLLATLLATPASDSLAQANLAEQFLATLSFTP